MPKKINTAPKLSTLEKSQRILNFALEKLDDIKAKEIIVIAVADRTSITDYMVIASGTSTQHVKSIARHLVQEAKKNHQEILNHEGQGPGEWAVIDLNDVIVHVMLPTIREYYQLEKFWSVEDLKAPALAAIHI